jgi:hypothetical protein
VEAGKAALARLAAAYKVRNLLTRHVDRHDFDRPRSRLAAKPSHTAETISASEAKENLKYAIDHCWPLLDDAGRDEIKAYFLDKTRAASSGGP